MSDDAFESLAAVAASLPFHIDDVQAVNAAYTRWHGSRRPAERRWIQLWTYCFVRRYFLVKFIQEPAHTIADMDELVDKTFRKVERNEGQLNDPSRYASWVSVICKNTYRNYLRSRRRAVSIDDRPTSALVSEAPRAYNDAGMAREALGQAIARLPRYLQTCVRLRFIEGLSYPEIADRTGRPLASIRAYVYKALQRLREDDDLRDFVE